MPKELYNEGRVVGYSSYELYVKHALSEYPDEEPATEREWLASQIGHGTSLVLKIKAESQTVSGVHSIDVLMPDSSKLLASNVVIGSIFFGNCKFDDKPNDTYGWARKVIDYGQGISNTNSSNPTTQTDASKYPKQTIKEFDDNQKKQFLQYMKIQDAVILQPGAWNDNEDEDRPPAKDFTPDYHNEPVLRITLASRVASDFYILLTGFTHRSIVAGISGIDQGSTHEVKPENGDFLGPELYPWANKIIFMHPPIASYYIRKYFASGHEKSTKKNPIASSTSETGRKDNLKIDHDEDDINTVFTSSYLYSTDGISIVGPTSAGGDITIGSKLGSTGSASNYLKITQRNSDTAHSQMTDIQPSVITAQAGIAYHIPSQPAEEVKISSMIGTANNYLQVIQKDKPNLNSDKVSASKSNNQITTSDLNSNSYGYTTYLKASEFTVDGGAIKIDPPATPGDNVKLTVKISSSNTNYLNVISSNGSTTLTPVTVKSKKHKDSNKHNYIVITQPTSSDRTVYVSLDYDTLYKDLKDDLASDSTWLSNIFKPIWTAIKSIINKIGPGTINDGKTLNTSNGSIDWNVDSKGAPGSAATGNLNIYSNNRYIISHRPDGSGDLNFN